MPHPELTVIPENITPRLSQHQLCIEVRPQHIGTPTETRAPDSPPDSVTDIHSADQLPATSLGRDHSRTRANILTQPHPLLQIRRQIATTLLTQKREVLVTGLRQLPPHNKHSRNHLELHRPINNTQLREIPNPQTIPTPVATQHTSTQTTMRNQDTRHTSLLIPRQQDLPQLTLTRHPLIPQSRSITRTTNPHPTLNLQTVMAKPRLHSLNSRTNITTGITLTLSPGNIIQDNITNPITTQTKQTTRRDTTITTKPPQTPQINIGRDPATPPSIIIPTPNIIILQQNRILTPRQNRKTNPPKNTQHIKILTRPKPKHKRARRDSNPRYPGPKPGALSWLGHEPIDDRSQQLKI